MTVENEKTRLISDDEIRQDILDTEKELVYVRVHYEFYKKGKEDREEFIAKLKAILAEREAKRTA